MHITRATITLGIGAAAAGVGVVVGASRLARGDDEQRRLVSKVFAGVGGAAAVGAVLARNTKAFGPLAGAGLGLAAAGVLDAMNTHRVYGEKLALDAGDLLPDAVQAAPREVYLNDGELHFDSVAGNSGAAPLQIALHYPNGDSDNGATNQVIFNTDGTAWERPLQGGLRLDERRDHNHLHFDDFVYFQLYKADANGNADEAKGEVSQGVKQSFYITDVQPFDEVSAENRAEANKLRKKGRFDNTVVKADVSQGISVGKADVYGAGIQGQSLEVGDLAAGRYVLRETFDPNDEVLEQDERNNAAETVIDVDDAGKVTIVSSKLADRGAYDTLADGRIVIPSVVASMKENVLNHGEHEHTD